MKPKVLIIVDTGLIGGPGKGLFLFLRSVPKEALDYLICNFEYRRPVPRGFNDFAAANDFALAPLKERFRFDPLSVWQAWKKLQQGGFNIIQSHNYKSHLVAFILSKLSGVPWLAMAHGWTSEDFKVKLYHALDGFFLRFADIAVAVSPPLHSTIAKWRGPNRPTHLILNAVEPVQPNDAKQAREAVRAGYGIPPSATLLGCFGRLSREKGQLILIESLHQLSSEMPSLFLLLAGDGPDRELINAKIAEYGLTGRVIQAGHQKSLRNFYQAIDLLVLPSLSEGLPNVALEAQAFSVPVLATDVGALREIIEDNVTGYLVAPGSKEVLAGRLKEIFSSSEGPLSVGRNGQAALYPKFDPKVRAAKFLKLYTSLLEKRAHGAAIRPSTKNSP